MHDAQRYLKYNATYCTFLMYAAIVQVGDQTKLGAMRHADLAIF
jgi:hypothetical protein